MECTVSGLELGYRELRVCLTMRGMEGCAGVSSFGDWGLSQLRRPVASDYGLLEINDGPLESMVACCLGQLGFPGENTRLAVLPNLDDKVGQQTVPVGDVVEVSGNCSLITTVACLACQLLGPSKYAK